MIDINNYKGKFIFNDTDATKDRIYFQHQTIDITERDLKIEELEKCISELEKEIGFLKKKILGGD